MTPVKYSVREFTPVVVNEKGNQLSFKLVFVDMVYTVLCMMGIIDPDDYLSPQVLLDAKCDDIPSCVAFATKKELGFETLYTYPLIMIARTIWSEVEYIARKYTRFRIDDVKYISDPDEIISTILANFGEGGRKFPLVGVLHTNDFKDREVAAAAAAGVPYHLPVSASLARHPRGLRFRHAVLIVGVDTTSDDPLMHNCEVKGSFGKGWGLDGFSRVGFEVFEYVLLPVYG